jgi:hypothetical protein
MDLASAGNACRSTSRCRATRRRFPLPSSNTTHVPTTRGCHRRSRTMSGASRRFRSSVLSRSCKSTSSLLISTMRRARHSAFHASRSTAPRSPQTANVTSAANCQPGILPKRRASSFCSAACRWSSRWASVPRCHLGSSSTRTSSAAPIRRIMLKVNSDSCPRSNLDTADLEHPAARARSSCRQPRLIRSSRKPTATRRSSMPPSSRSGLSPGCTAPYRASAGTAVRHCSFAGPSRNGTRGRHCRASMRNGPSWGIRELREAGGAVSGRRGASGPLTTAALLTIDRQASARRPDTRSRGARGPGAPSRPTVLCSRRDRTRAG